MRMLCAALMVSQLVLTSPLHAQWVQTNGPYTNVNCFAISGMHVFAGTNYGAFLSTNNGTSWMAINTGMTYRGISALAFSNTYLFAATDIEVYVSTDNGSSWTAAGLNHAIASFAFSAASAYYIYAGGWSGNIFRAFEMGTYWTQVKQGGVSSGRTVLCSDNGAKVYACTQNGDFRSTDYGTNWQAISNGLPTSCIVNALVFTTKLFAGTNDGVFLSTDFGTSWTPVNTGLTNTNVQSLAVAGTNLFAGTWGGGIFLSGNDGTGWTPVNAGLTNTLVSALAASGTNLFAGPNDGTVWRRPLSEMVLGNPTTIALSSGNNQSGAINKGLANPFVVTVTGAGSNPISGASVSFAIVSAPSGATGQELSTTMASTNSSGQASSVLTAGNKVGQYTVTATSSGLSGSPITFSATATAGVATTIALASGNNQSGAISMTLVNPFIVTVTDAGGNPVPGVTVNFAIAAVPNGATGQSLSTTTFITGTSGQAWSVLTLGNKTGTYTVTATSSGLSGSPVTFTATATVGSATTIALTSGNNQSSAINTALSNPFVVTVTDAGGNPITSAGVNFAIATTPTGATGQSLSITTATTNSSGQASSVLSLGNKAGTYTVTATSSGLSGSPLTFTATATTGAASTIALTSGNNQSGAISMTLVNPFIVTVTDAGGNPVPGVTVNFAIAAVPTGATGQSVSITLMSTNSSGQASTLLTLGSKPGVYTVTATSSSLSGNPVTFTATATTGAASTIALTSGNNQSGAISMTLVNPFIVTVTDAGGNPVPGVTVNFAIAAVPNGATGQSLSTTTFITGTSGQAWSVLTLGNKTGTYTVTATSSGLSGSPITFTATATAGVGTTITLTSGNNQSGLISTTLANPFVVTVTDVGGNPVSALHVSFAMASAPAGATGQFLDMVPSGGIGQVSSLFGLGNKAGTYTVTATSSGLSGSPVTFTATATNPAPTLSGIFANRAGRGSVINVTLTGTNFLQGVTTVGFGPDITVNSQTLTSIIQIVANITISSSAATGGRDVTVTNASPGGGTATLTNGFTIDTSVPTSVERLLGAAPGDFALYDSYPNPFNPSTRIAFSIPKTAFVQLRILDALGREVALLVNGERAAGNYEVQWDAGSHPSGIYFYRLQARQASGGQAADASTGSAQGFVETKRMVLLK